MLVVLTLGSAQIATLGLMANSAAVVIGAMVVASWILPWFLGSLRTLLLGAPAPLPSRWRWAGW